MSRTSSSAAFFKIAKHAVRKWWEDDALRLSAALSYYTFFSLAPLLTIAVGMASAVFDTPTVEEAVLHQFQKLVGETGAAAIKSMLDTAMRPARGAVATTVSVLTLLFIATGVFGELQDSLNLIWQIRPAKGTAGFWQALKNRFLSFILVIGSGFLLLVSLIISTMLSVLSQYLDRFVPGPQLMITLIDLVVSLGIITLLFAIMFKVLPDAHIAWRHVWIGAVATSLLFTIGKWAIGLYLGSGGLRDLYGAASSLMVILLWVYYSSLIFFLGAEFTVVYAKESKAR
jgi:membrane protein